MELKKKGQMISGNRNPIPVHSQVKKIKEEECSSESPGRRRTAAEMRLFLDSERSPPSPSSFQDHLLD
ncbi:hypothetical protein Pint_16895 [Pistacia integerrima]|uniref:Uncharacterized protein n=1 Tax=Pistacia integerrima TaxID=434235 RepID=A0ACC0ZDZ7_9ROSI|nr:hypothetical protein Pint_16895 [Pistacia integerrima]